MSYLTRQAAEPTPRPDRISKDYKAEYPSIEVGGRTVLNKKKKEKEGNTQQNNMENVKLDGEVDSGLNLGAWLCRYCFFFLTATGDYLS